jgi:hypothetical protein
VGPALGLMLKNVVCHGTETLILESLFAKKEKRHLVGDKKNYNKCFST